jgi:hypothetical protein
MCAGWRRWSRGLDRHRFGDCSRRASVHVLDFGVDPLELRLQLLFAVVQLGQASLPGLVLQAQSVEFGFVLSDTLGQVFQRHRGGHHRWSKLQDEKTAK